MIYLLSSQLPAKLAVTEINDLNASENHSYAHVGTDHVNEFNDTDCKFAFTAIGGVTMRGDKLPFWLLASGSKAVCHCQFGPYANNNECIADQININCEFTQSYKSV